MINRLSFTEDQRDCLQEVINVAMGQAGDLLARFLNTFVHLSIPNVRVVAARHLVVELESALGSQSYSVSGVMQSFYSLDQSKDLQGDAIVVFDDQSLTELAQMVLTEQLHSKATNQERLLDVSTLLTSACLNGLSRQMELVLGVSPPQVLGESVTPASLLNGIAQGDEQILVVQITYTIDDRPFQCHLFFLVENAAIKQIRDLLDQLLEDL